MSDYFINFTNVQKYYSIYNKIKNTYTEFTIFFINNTNDIYTSVHKLDKLLHRENGPALIITFQSHVVIQYYKFGKKHRIDGPAYIFYSKPGCYAEQWWLNNTMHNTKGPSNTLYYDDKCYIAEYYINGLRRNTG